MNIFVAQLNFRIQSESLKEIFEEYGEVTNAKVIKDQATGRSKGFGFVEMTDEQAALTAIEELNGAEVEGKTIVVKKANPRPEGGAGGGGNRGGGFRSGGGGRDRGPRRHE
jgi:RNA recognition motif-containing protein